MEVRQIPLWKSYPILNSISVIHNPGKRVSNARNLALQHLDEDVTHCLEIIGHSWVDADHVEGVNDLVDLEEELVRK